MLHHLDSTKKKLIGRPLNNISRLGDATIRLDVGDNHLCDISVTGDCCSESLFYDFQIPESVLGGIIEDVLERVDSNYDTDYAAVKAKDKFGMYLEELSVWDVVIKTSKGEARLNHINSSNGYYDGETSYSFTW